MTPLSTDPVTLPDPAAPAAGGAGNGGSAGSEVSRGGAIGVWWRRLRLWLVLALALLAVLALYAIYQSRTERGALDPDAPTPAGSRALATLLRDRDITVDEVVDVQAAMDTAGDGEVTLLIPFPELLSSETVDRLPDLPSSVRVVLVEPDPFTLEDLGLDVEVDEVEPYVRVDDPQCEFREAVSAGDAEIGRIRYSAPSEATRCYRGSLIVASDDGAEIVILGANEPLTNDRLDEHGNAALSLGLLNERPRLLWLLPAGPEPGTGEERPSLSDILPPWVPAATLLLMVTATLAALWRSRRLGPPVAEPLPVVVRSAETVEGRARLYRRARARAEAYDALRAGALARLLPALGLGGTADYRAVVEAISERSGLPMAEVYAALYGPPPPDDAALVAAADALDAVVRSTLAPSQDGTAQHRFDGEGRPQ